MLKVTNFIYKQQPHGKTVAFVTPHIDRFLMRLFIEWVAANIVCKFKNNFKSDKQANI